MGPAEQSSPYIVIVVIAFSDCFLFGVGVAMKSEGSITGFSL